MEEYQYARARRLLGGMRGSKPWVWARDAGMEGCREGEEITKNPGIRTIRRWSRVEWRRRSIEASGRSARSAHPSCALRLEELGRT